MAFKGKNYSKKGRPAGTHCCRVCKRPLSGSRIKSEKDTCAEHETPVTSYRYR